MVEKKIVILAIPVYGVYLLQATLAGFRPFLTMLLTVCIGHYYILLANHTRVCCGDVATGLVVVGCDSVVTFVFKCDFFWHHRRVVYFLLTTAL